jgi:shikimate kinase
MPGAGKSTVGRQLARRLKLPFIDADQVLETRLGCSVRHYFEVQGEECFRDKEELLLQELTEFFRGVLSTGGGAVLRSGNRTCLKRRSKVVYLRLSPDEVYRRLRYDSQRPLLQVADPKARLREMFEVRDPLYLEIAHVVIETDRSDVAQFVNLIQTELGLIPPADPVS